MLAGGSGSLACWCPPRCCAPLGAHRPAVLCPPAVGACCPPPCGVGSGPVPCVPVPPRGAAVLWLRRTFEMMDRCQAIAIAPFRHQRAPWRPHGCRSHPHAHESCVGAGTTADVVRSRGAGIRPTITAQPVKGRSRRAATNRRKPLPFICCYLTPPRAPHPDGRVPGPAPRTHPDGRVDCGSKCRNECECEQLAVDAKHTSTIINNIRGCKETTHCPNIYIIYRLYIYRLYIYNIYIIIYIFYILFF